MPEVARRFHPQRVRRTVGAASCVREPVRFMLREIRGEHAVGAYRLRDSGLLAQVRHPLLDMWVLEEVFRFRVYQPPPPALAALRALPRPPRVADLGGHVGLFGLFVLGLFSEAELTSFEPDPRNVSVLRRCVAANGLESRWQVVEACAATDDGTTQFSSSFHLSRAGAEGSASLSQLQAGIEWTFPFLSGSELLTVQEHDVECRDAFPALSHADLIKIDIEGGEWELLSDPRFAGLPAAAIVLEYHPAYCPDPDAEALVIRALDRAGFTVGERARGVDAGMLWAWRDAPPSS